MPYITKNKRPARVSVLLIAILGALTILIGINQFNSASGLTAGLLPSKVCRVGNGDMECSRSPNWIGNSSEIISTQQVLCQIGTVENPRFATECHAAISVPRRKFTDLEIGQKVVLEPRLASDTITHFPSSDHAVCHVVSLFDQGGDDVLVTFAFANNKEAKSFSQGKLATIWINTSTEDSVPRFSPVLINEFNATPFVSTGL